MFSKKKSTSDQDKPKEDTDLKIRLDTLETESINEQLREIEAKKARDGKKA